MAPWIGYHFYVYNDRNLTLSRTMYQRGHKRRPGVKEGPHKIRPRGRDKSYLRSLIES